MNNVTDLHSLLQWMKEFFLLEFQFGELSFTPLSIILGITALSIIGMVSARLKHVLRDRILPRTGMHRGEANAIATLCAYAVLVLGVLFILPLMIPGFNLSTFFVLLGALSVGIGFGLRNIADNFVSGLILLFERPIKVGDRIEVEGVFGEVIEIRARSTTVRTNDNIDIIVPNSQFISGQVTNLSHNDERIRLRFPVGVHYKSDVHQVQAALLEAVRHLDGVLEDPAPAVRFLNFGDSSLEFELRVWTEKYMTRPNILRSLVYFSVWTVFKKYGIEIPYPQRDLYIKELPANRFKGMPAD